MIKFIVASLIILAALLYANSYINEVVNQYNNMSGFDQLRTKLYCNTGGPALTMQDRIDCRIIKTR